MAVYYNDNDPFAAAWLRELIKAGHIAPGDVDERSIEDVKPEELEGYTQCHFFAGIGGWSYALRLAGWPDDRPVWTGSPPCQPFSTAGRRGGYDDSRHLAPAWLNLVAQCRPPVVFGEQVASAFTNAKHHWIDDLQDVLEAEGYAVGKIVLPACSVGAPHIRQRGWFVAERVGDTCGQGLQEQQRHRGDLRKTQTTEAREASERGGASVSGMVDVESERLNGIESAAGQAGRYCAQDGSTNSERPGTPHSQWQSADWLLCRDGKWRPVEPGTFPLADGAPARVGRLRGYGNGINAEAAAEVVSAYLEAT